MALARRYWPVAGLIFVLHYVGYAIYVVFRGVASPLSLALGIARSPDLAHLFVLGLVAGSLSFGGAYTSIPFVQAEAVVLGGWLPQQVFIDCIAEHASKSHHPVRCQIAKLDKNRPAM
jgi:hypothetical protein